jgi:predicted lipoprotein with Yx(FWY)xxD motif
MRVLRNLALACLAGGACAGLTACGAGSAAAARPAYELHATALPGAGQVLTDGRGFTLYVYLPDHRGPSRCSGLCARDWPPLLLPAGAGHAAAGQGVKAALLGTVRRPGGARQVTYNGWPLYLWQGDHEPGQATGQADDMGLWYVLSASGAVDTRPVTGQAGD